MIRGRHRILPVAIDRAVMLPSELQRQLDQDSDNRSDYAAALQSSMQTAEDNSNDPRFDRRRVSSPTVNPV